MIDFLRPQVSPSRSSGLLPCGNGFLLLQSNVINQPMLCLIAMDFLLTLCLVKKLILPLSLKRRTRKEISLLKLLKLQNQGMTELSFSWISVYRVYCTEEIGLKHAWLFSKQQFTSASFTVGAVSLVNIQAKDFKNNKEQLVSGAGESHTGRFGAAFAGTTAFLCGAEQLAETKIWQVAIHYLFVTCLGPLRDISIWYLEIL